MRLLSRIYRPGDEVQVNRLYKLITNIERSFEEYKWEWLETWNGRGSMYLVFDKDRKSDDQLICQYSLIPTPFMVFGKSYMGAKTENCMSHPDYRGKGIYFLHEKKYFEDAKKKYQLFFTTTGSVSKGVPGKIRKKLGYIPFDFWTNYYYFINTKNLRSTIHQGLKQKFGDLLGLTKIVSQIVTTSYTKIFRGALPYSNQLDKSVIVIDNLDSNLDEIENLWILNKEIYGISVDRNKDYIKWRFDQNPYIKHKYILSYKDGKLNGYLIVYCDNKNNFRIVDILVQNKDENIVEQLLINLKIYAKKEGINAIVFSTLLSNKFFKRVFNKNHFIDPTKFSLKKSRLYDFFIFVNDVIKSEIDYLDHDNWYITGIVKEGR